MSLFSACYLAYSLRHFEKMREIDRFFGGREKERKRKVRVRWEREKEKKRAGQGLTGQG